MREFFNQIGIDGGLLLSQAVNFVIVLIVLRIFAYNPLLKVLKERKSRIEDGIVKSEEADKRLGEINELTAQKMREAEKRGIELLRETEERAKKEEARLLVEAHSKESEILKKAKKVAESKHEEALRRLEGEAGELVKTAICRTCELDPESVDNALIEKAVREMSKT